MTFVVVSNSNRSSSPQQLQPRDNSWKLQQSCFPTIQSHFNLFGDSFRISLIILTTESPTLPYFVRSVGNGILISYLMITILSSDVALVLSSINIIKISLVIFQDTQDVQCVFLPELRKAIFGSVDPCYSALDEEDMDAPRVEFGTST